MPGLPDSLERIPIETFEHALTLLRLQRGVDRERIGVVGVSKGGELALLLASMRPEIRATVAFVPSSVVWQSIAPGWPKTSSWTRHGKELPFVPYGRPSAEGGGIAAIYRSGLENAEAVAGAVIPVERINGPILLLSGRSDTLWPSAAMSDAVMKRLEANGFSPAHEHVAYDDAGHGISAVRDDVSHLGGTNEGNAKAQLDARRRMLEFLGKSLARR
jgi:dienelactone hydrolase